MPLILDKTVYFKTPEIFNKKWYTKILKMCLVKQFKTNNIHISCYTSNLQKYPLPGPDQRCVYMCVYIDSKVDISAIVCFYVRICVSWSLLKSVYLSTYIFLNSTSAYLRVFFHTCLIRCSIELTLFFFAYSRFISPWISQNFLLIPSYSFLICNFFLCYSKRPKQ